MATDPNARAQYMQRNTGASPLQSYLTKMEQAAEQARVANIERKNQILSIYDQMAQMYQPGGAFTKAGLADIERSKVKGTGQEMQQMISSGLYGTTTTAGIGRRWESEVGAPARTKLEDLAYGRLGDVMGQKAGFMERIEEPYPDYATIANLAGQVGNQPQNLKPNRPSRSNPWGMNYRMFG